MRGERLRNRRLATTTCGVALVVLLLAGLMACAASAAQAQAPRWHVDTIGNPSRLVPNSPLNEEEEVTVDATGGTFTLTWHQRTGLGLVTREKTVPLAYDAPASEVEAALDKLSFLDNGTSVSGTGSGETAPYKVTFIGEAGDAPQVLTADGADLTGGSAVATVRELVHGVYEPELLVMATNVGGADAQGSQITLSDELPPGMTVNTVSGWNSYKSLAVIYGNAFGGHMSCEDAASGPTCTSEEAVMPGDSLVMRIRLDVAADAEGAPNVASVVGGGAEATSTTPLDVGSSTPSFGPQPGSVFAAVSNAQAGGHPDVTTGFALNTQEKGIPAADPKKIRFDLPPGLVGQAAGMPRCTMAAVFKEFEHPFSCPSDTIVGMATVTILMRLGQGEGGEAPFIIVAPVFNIAPAPGEPVALAFDPFFPIRLDTSVLSNGKYGVRVTAQEVSEDGGVLGTTLTIWGVPNEYSGHGSDLTYFSLAGQGFQFFGGPQENLAPVPLLTNPQRCGAPLIASMEADSWTNIGHFVGSGPLSMGSLTGCELLRFEPKFSMLPDTLEAGKPAGYNFKLEVPQHNEVERPATPNVKNVTLTLPAGTVINPSAAWGLKACSNEQFYGPPVSGEEPAEPANCPRQSQVGTVAIESPDIEETLEGQVYLAEPECTVCTAKNAQDGEMVRLFVNVVGNGEGRVVVKLEGRGHINTETGQIETVFEESPQLPFSEFKMKLTGGPRAVLANPRTCGPVSSSLNMDSWDEALPESALSYGFEVKENCFGPQFKPSFAAGMPNIQAGAHGEFTLAFGRTDDDEFLKQITMKMPPGLLGTLKGIPLCGQAQANAGSCGAGSLIGEAQVLTGPGADPFLVEGGRVYLTKGYGGSQFGLSIVVPAKAGPYTLGGINGEGRETDNGLVVVRSQLFIDPHTAQITAVSGTLPSMLDGIPLQLKAVNVKLNRPGFMFNPTSCAHMKITGSIASQEGMTADVSEPFQVTNCARLPFEPKLTALTHAHHSREKGAYLHVVVKSGPGQANLRYVRVELPEALPSELRTLQHACTEEQFEANPAGCPPQSIVGHARAITPVLPVPLTGPAYFVSHAGKKFPELIVVLQGYGVTVDLAGETFISKKSVTSSTFKTVPDVPVSRFDLVLPEREYSALGATTNFCKHPQVMPTRMIGQNGKVVERNTKIEVTGCGTFIAVRHKHVHGDKATILLHTSGAGKLIANGRGISRKVKRVKKKGGRVGITVKLKRRLRRQLRHSHTHQIEVHVHLTFKARNGKGTGKATVTVKLK